VNGKTFALSIGLEAAILLAPGLAVAEDHLAEAKTQDNGSDYRGSVQIFKCEAVKNRNHIAGSELPRTVTVSLTLKDNKATELKIVYVDDNGKQRNPADDASSWHLVTVPGHKDYNWYGMVQGHNTLIHGRLFEQHPARNGEKIWTYKEERWAYNEEKFEKGLKTSEYQTICKPNMEPSTRRDENHDKT
jgi:hypothetical protein